jgi:hypothetical protein
MSLSRCRLIFMERSLSQNYVRRDSLKGASSALLDGAIAVAERAERTRAAVGKASIAAGDAGFERRGKPNRRVNKSE